MQIHPIFLKDFYKVDHYRQYPAGTSLIFSNFTPRKSRMDGINYSVFFGINYFIKYYLAYFSYNLKLKSTAEKIQNKYNEIMLKTLGSSIKHQHIEMLYNLGYLPLAIYALPEKSIIPCRVPALVLYNTHPDFYWLPNMIETIMSCTLWGMCTSATIAREYRILLDSYAEKTSDIPEFVDYQAHDFSFRGMFGLEAAMLSGCAHLQYFKGTDTIPALFFNDIWYDQSLRISSVPATEHSVMSAYGKENEFETYKRLITEIYPEGIISIVSDTWDLWTVVGKYLPILKDIIMNRNGKVVIRPDSGDPVDIICGSTEGHTFEQKGLIECLWNIFGGTINSKGYKQLDPHIGAIYGDSITIDRAKCICELLKQKGFASTNIVFGIGSYTYQYNTRDTLGWAFKSTYCEINGIGKPITKDPITDDGTKRSHSGILKVIKDGDTYKVLENQTWSEFYKEDNELNLVFKNGQSFI